jgi:hypothetical protein
MLINEITRRDFLGGMAGAALLPKAALANKRTFDPFNKEDQDFIFEWVAAQRKMQINPSYPRPKVVDFAKIDKNVFKETWGFLPDGAPNTYHWIRNWVILSMTSPNPASSLAHEYVHYFQFTYDAKGNIKQLDWDGVSEDRYEVEALNIQRKFKETFN